MHSCAFCSRLDIADNFEIVNTKHHGALFFCNLDCKLEFYAKVFNA